MNTSWKVGINESLDIINPISADAPQNRGMTKTTENTSDPSGTSENLAPPVPDEPKQPPIQQNKSKRKFCSLSKSNNISKVPIAVMSKDDTAVHIVANIRDGHDDDDQYFCAYIYPSPNTPLASPIEVPAANSTTQNPVQIPAEYADLSAAFSDGLTHLPEHGDHDMSIELQPGTSPSWGPLYNMTEVEQEIVHKYVKDMLDKGLIQPSKSPCGAPILFAKKKDGSLRLCVDYRRLNDITVKNVYPLPLIDSMLDRLSGSKYFTTLDLKDAYWLIRIKAGDEWKMAFRTCYGLFESL